MCSGTRQWVRDAHEPLDALPHFDPVCTVMKILLFSAEMQLMDDMPKVLQQSELERGTLHS